MSTPFATQYYGGAPAGAPPGGDQSRGYPQQQGYGGYPQQQQGQYGYQGQPQQGGYYVRDS